MESFIVNVQEWRMHLHPSPHCRKSTFVLGYLPLKGFRTEPNQRCDDDGASGKWIKASNFQVLFPAVKRSIFHVIFVIAYLLFFAEDGSNRCHFWGHETVLCTIRCSAASVWKAIFVDLLQSKFHLNDYGEFIHPSLPVSNSRRILPFVTLGMWHYLFGFFSIRTDWSSNLSRRLFIGLETGLLNK